ncbi:hypothetical protein GE09DRAFT_702195 [Coniochaeta sp. 2T2.1]|nr:hypothetical protein GE09DRAFT_702195 [Coniochaeta sp. 2T2.1]
MALTKTFLLAAWLSTALAAIETDHVYLCGRVATYVDGGLYVVKNSDGSTSGIVGDHVNGASKFEFTLALTDPADKQPYGPEWPILLTEPGPGYNTFFRHNLTPYILGLDGCCGYHLLEPDWACWRCPWRQPTAPSDDPRVPAGSGNGRQQCLPDILEPDALRGQRVCTW